MSFFEKSLNWGLTKRVTGGIVLVMGLNTLMLAEATVIGATSEKNTQSKSLGLQGSIYTGVSSVTCSNLQALFLCLEQCRKRIVKNLNTRRYANETASNLSQCQNLGNRVKELYPCISSYRIAPIAHIPKQRTSYYQTSTGAFAHKNPKYNRLVRTRGGIMTKAYFIEILKATAGALILLIMFCTLLALSATVEW